MNSLKKYLPSRKFISIFLIFVIFVTLFFLIKETIYLITDKNSKNINKGLISVTVGGIIQKDSNNNGIADWEEYLWGLDPNKNGPANKAFILEKKKALVNSGDIVIPNDSATITDNDILSRQFLATIISLQQTGELNDGSMASVSEALGKNIEATPIADIYTMNMLSIQNDSLIANNAYSDALGKLVNKYKDSDIGSELTFVIQGLSNKDPQALFAATTVATAYQSFGKDLIKIPVPKSLASTHLSMANNYEKTGQSIKDLAQMLSDPIIGMKSIINYKNYSDALVSDLEKLSGILQ